MNKTKYTLTVFKNRFQTTGRKIERTFEELYLGFKNNYKITKERFSAYEQADKQTQGNIKDVGGFIGGETENNRRVNGIKITRQLLTLDIDVSKSGVLPYLERNVDFYCLVYTTHSHSPEKNRFRIVAPLSREVNADEYEALGRRIAYNIENPEHETFKGLFDETTFQANRLMFLPSVSMDGEYICELLNLDMLADEQKIIDVDKVLDDYNDRNDIYEWFAPEKQDKTMIGKNTLTNKSPLKAKGLVGAFNRTYSITQAIDKFLPHIYVKEKRNDRYTFVGGDSYGGGLVLNDDTIFYSHHGTDPANLFYRSAFDLVRIHLFGKYDSKFTPEKEIEDGVYENTESFLKMIEFCKDNTEVVLNSDANLALRQRLEKQQDFIQDNFTISTDKDDLFLEPVLNEDGIEVVEPEIVDEKEVARKEKEEDETWLALLGNIKSKVGKMDVIFDHDSIVGNLFYYDTFRDNICFDRQAYWHSTFTKGQPLQDRDMSHIRVHLEKVYDITGAAAIDDAIVVEADKIQRNKVLDWFESLEWDGTERLETFFNEFFKVPLNPFTRSAFKHWLVGAVSRIYRAGSPMDLLLIIKGAQGIGKSLFFKKLATIDFNMPEDHLYSDTKIDFQKSKDSYEQLEGIWIYEWKELAGMNMSDQESIKAFVDKTEDKFRRSYGRRNVELKRRVAFGGTTNEKTPLRDRSGNRRFLVMESGLEQHECYINKPHIFTQELRDQLIAEAIDLYKGGFDIFNWTEEELEWWEKTNDDNLTENDLNGIIGAYLTMKKPINWYSLSMDQMRDYYRNYDFVNDKSNDLYYSKERLMTYDKVCVRELWTIVINNNKASIDRYHRDLIIASVEHNGWMQTKTQARFGHFGKLNSIVPVPIVDEKDLPF